MGGDGKVCGDFCSWNFGMRMSESRDFLDWKN